MKLKYSPSQAEALDRKCPFCNEDLSVFARGGRAPTFVGRHKEWVAMHEACFAEVYQCNDLLH